MAWFGEHSKVGLEERINDIATFVHVLCVNTESNYLLLNCNTFGSWAREL